jgi:hypothetical protein
MSGTALDHRLVRDYLNELDAAMRGLPAAKVRELREQIAAHLADELPPDADDQQIADALGRLGPADVLAAEAGAAAVDVSAAPPSRLARALVKRVRPRTWIAIALLLIAVAVAGKWCDYYLSAGSLQFWYGGDWWYPQDVQHQQISSINAQSQMFPLVQNTTPIRSGQRQGYVIAIFNPNNVTETIVGDASGQPTGGWNNPGSATDQIGVSHSYTDIANGVVGEDAARGIAFGLPVSIPPHQSRLVRVLWTSDICLGNGETNGINALNLWVRVGWFTRAEVIPQQGWYLIGPSRGRCAG